jgi:hypothetical protein
VNSTALTDASHLAVQLHAAPPHHQGRGAARGGDSLLSLSAAAGALDSPRVNLAAALDKVMQVLIAADANVNAVDEVRYAHASMRF